MGVEYTVEIDGDMLMVTTRGSDDHLDESVSYAEAILGLCLENHCSKVLVDESKLTGILDKVAIYQLVKQMRSKIPYDLNIAYVINPEHFDDATFGILVAENRGIRVQAFLSKDLAQAWLQEKVQS